MFSAEFRASLQAGIKTVRKAASQRSASLPQSETFPDDGVDQDDHTVDAVGDPDTMTMLAVLALPPIPPEWGHILCGRSHEAASVLQGRMAMLAVGCRLGINPSQGALEQAARCRSVGAVRSLLTITYGSRGLSTAFELAGILQPPKLAESVPHSKASQSAETAEQLVSRQGFTSQARILRWFDRPEPVRPVWRTRWLSADQSDGAWCGSACCPLARSRLPRR
jgi:hypothetical protein